MNFFGVYHSNTYAAISEKCDAPCITKGRMRLCAAETASSGDLIAFCIGRLRNRYALLQLLGLRGSPTNSEIALQAYRKWGSTFSDHLEGPVIAGVLNAARDEMILSRDRMGELTLFYSRDASGGIAFSDHPDTLLRAGMFRPVVDREGMCELFGLGPARTPGRTPYRDLRELEPGCRLIACGSSMTIDRYFDISGRPHTENAHETIVHTRALLDRAIDDIAALHPGAMLSGGLDSTALTALLAAQGARIKTFSVDYRDNEKDYRPSTFRPSMDAPFIELAARALNCDHHGFILEQAELADSLQSALDARGFPGMADIDGSLWLFAGRIAPHARCVISGECGDEVFGGYPWFRGDAPLSENAFPWSGSMELRESVLHPETAKRLNLTEYVSGTLVDAIRQANVPGAADDREARLKRIQKLCFRFFMANLQERARTMCTAQGLSVITPLCDERLVEYVYNVPWAMKFMNGAEKGLFRAAVADCVPPEINERRKSPYPKTCSPIYAKIIRERTLKMLADPDAPLNEWIDVQAVRRLAESELDAAAAPWFGQLMAGPQMLAYLLQINLWIRERNIRVEL